MICFLKNGQDQFWRNDIEQNGTQQNDTVQNHIGQYIYIIKKLSN